MSLVKLWDPARRVVLRGLFFCLLLLLLPTGGNSAEAAKPPKRILFLTADGFRRDYIEWYQPSNLLGLISRGVRVTHCTNVFPTVTNPNMTALVTGAYPRTTGIAGNSQYEKEEDRIKDKLRDNRAETISETLQKAGWRTAAVNHFILEGSGTDIYISAGYDESEKTTDAILKACEDEKVRFVGAIYGATDHAGHRHGPRSDEVKEAVLGIDRAVGRLLSVLRQRGWLDDTLIVFSADHGMSAFESKQVSIEPAKALTQAGFKVATSQAELKPDTELVVLDSGVRVVYFRAALSDSQKEKVMTVLSDIKGAEVLDRKRLDALGCHNNRSGDLIVSPLEGYTIKNAGKVGGQHGRFTEQNPILILAGPGIKRNVLVESGRTVDVVPTLLHLVQVPPARTVDGAVLKAALE